MIGLINCVLHDYGFAIRSIQCKQYDKQTKKAKYIGRKYEIQINKELKKIITK
jgi:hypothetical protein